MTSLIDQYAHELAQVLAQRGATVTAAESCTAGGIAEAITRVPGSSAWFDCSFVTYSNRSKSQLLGIPAQLIAEQGAVSQAVVQAMAAGAMARASADFAVAVSGIAGPSGGSADKPVGTVWFAWAGVGVRSHARCRHFNGSRAEVREQAVIEALVGVLECARSTV